MSFTTENPIIQYSGNDVTDEFDLDHKYYDDDDIVVILTSALGVHTIQTITTHYTLAGIVTDPAQTTTCTVTMVTAPATGETLTIFRKRDIQQILSLISQAGWHDATLEQHLDYHVMIMQYLQLQLDKAVKYNMAFAGSVKTGEEMEALTTGVNDGNIIVEIDGQGAVPVTGQQKKFRVMPYAGTIESVTLLGDAVGSAVVDIWKTTYTLFATGVHPVNGDSITASAPPTLSSEDKSVDSALVGWATTFAKGDILDFNLDSASTLTKITLEIKILKAGS